MGTRGLKFLGSTLPLHAICNLIVCILYLKALLWIPFCSGWNGRNSLYQPLNRNESPLCSTSNWISVHAGLFRPFGWFRWILVGRTVSASIEKCIIFFFTILILSSLMTVIYMNKPTYGTHHHFVVVWTHPAACPFLASSLCFNLCSSLLHFFLFFGLSIFPPIFSVCFGFLTFIFHFFVLWATTWD